MTAIEALDEYVDAEIDLFDASSGHPHAEVVAKAKKRRDAARTVVLSLMYCAPGVSFSFTVTK